MKRCLYYFTCIALMALLFSGCEKDEEPFNETNSNLKESVFEVNPGTKLQDETLPDYFVSLLNNYESKLINTYNVTHTGRVVNGTGANVTTTFNYTVSGTNQTPQLDSFSLEIPDCAGTPSGWSPQQASSFKNGILKWNSSLPKDGNENFSITFNGDVPLGIINSTVTRGSNSETAKIIGPCNGVYNLSGIIYIDADKNGEKDESESGIPSFPVDLMDSQGELLFTVSTNSEGFYSIKVLEGSYKVGVGENFLNNIGYTPIKTSIVDLENISGDITGLDFGYTINSAGITQALDDGSIRVNTQPTKYWIQAIRDAGKRNSTFSKDQIRGLLVEIEGLYLPEPFQFGRDKEKTALSILSKPIRTDLDEFLQQLLTAQLNVVSGLGAIESSGELNTIFNDALLIYGEAVACTENGNCPDESSKAVSTSQNKAVSNLDTGMYLSFNGSGGINR